MPRNEVPLVALSLRQAPGDGAKAEGGDGAVSDRNPFLAAALDYAARGWRVLPIRPRAKTPLTPRGVYAATSDPARIRRWWAKWPTANVAIATGDGLLVVDVDGPDGEAALADLDLPPTLTVQTGRGRHLYFADPSGEGKCCNGILDHVDTKAAGGYVLAPPSVHPSGAIYTWAEGRAPEDLPLAEAPTWAKPAPQPAPKAKHNLPRLIPEGQRNDTLTRLAGSLWADGLTLDELTTRLLAENEARCRPLLPEAEVRAIARSVARYPQAPGGATVRIAKSLLKRGLSPGALVFYGVLQALRQAGQGKPRQKTLAEVLGVTPRTVRSWAGELAAAGLAEYERPSRRYLRSPVALLTDPGLPYTAKATALHLLALMDGDGTVTVGQETLARACGQSVATVKRHLRAVRERGHLLTMVAPFNPELGRRERTNRYAVLAMAPQQAQTVTPEKRKLVTRSNPRAQEKRKLVTRESKPFTRARGRLPLPESLRVPVSRVPREWLLTRERCLEEEGAKGGPRPYAAAGAAPKQSTMPQPALTASSPVPPSELDPGEQAVAQGLAIARGLQVAYVLALIRRHGLAQVQAILGHAA